MSKSFKIWKWMTERSILDFRVKNSPYFLASNQTSWHYLSLAFLFRIINGNFFPFVAEMSGIFWNFVIIRRISLYKGDAEDWEILGLQFGDCSCVPLVASGKAERSIQCSAINCLKEHPTRSHRLFHDSSSGAMVRIYFQFPKYSLGEIFFCIELKYGIWLRFFLFFQFVSTIPIPATWDKYALIHQLIKKHLYSCCAGT